MVEAAMATQTQSHSSSLSAPSCSSTNAHSNSNTHDDSNIVTNRSWFVRKLVKDKFSFQDHFRWDESSMNVDDSIANLEENQLLVQTIVFSVDAYVRTTLQVVDDNKGGDGDEKTSYHGTATVGDLVRANGIGRVVGAGTNLVDRFPVGSLVQSPFLPVSNYAVVNPTTGMVFSISETEGSGDAADLKQRLRLRLGLLGLSGMAAYVGMHQTSLGSPKEGETVLISAAAGGVGSIACQMARALGARVVGIAGGETKQRFLRERLQLDGTIDYKHPTKSIGQQLEETCPEGIDFFFDNVGGELLDFVLENINVHGRICLCGAVSQYDGHTVTTWTGPRNYLKLAEQSATMAGFSLLHTSPAIRQAFAEHVSSQLEQGQIEQIEDLRFGLASFGPALEDMFAGNHLGRLLIDV